MTVSVPVYENRNFARYVKEYRPGSTAPVALLIKLWDFDFSQFPVSTKRQVLVGYGVSLDAKEPQKAAERAYEACRSHAERLTVEARASGADVSYIVGLGYSEGEWNAAREDGAEFVLLTE